MRLLLEILSWKELWKIRKEDRSNSFISESTKKWLKFLNKNFESKIKKSLINGVSSSQFSFSWMNRRSESESDKKWRAAQKWVPLTQGPWVSRLNQNEGIRRFVKCCRRINSAYPDGTATLPTRHRVNANRWAQEQRQQEPRKKLSVLKTYLISI